MKATTAKLPSSTTQAYEIYAKAPWEETLTQEMPSLSV